MLESLKTQAAFVLLKYSVQHCLKALSLSVLNHSFLRLVERKQKEVLKVHMGRRRKILILKAEQG